MRKTFLLRILCAVGLLQSCDASDSRADQERNGGEEANPSLDAPPSPPPGVIAVDESGEYLRAYDDVSELNQIIKENFDDTLADVAAQNGKPASLAETQCEEENSLECAEVTRIGPFLTFESHANIEAMAMGQSIKYDDAEWHYGGDFPEGAPISYGFTHIGFFLTWIVEVGLESQFIQTQSPDELSATRLRKVSPIGLLESWDGSLVDDMLSDQGNAFAATYYSMSGTESGYLADYFTVFDEVGAYEVAPSWENYDRIKPLISRRYEEWKAESAKP